MDIDRVLSNLTAEVFSNLDTGDHRIIMHLARSGSLNMKEIGNKTSKYCASFDRWGVQKRLRGTRNFIGLIPCDYIIEINKNEKETKYGLTLKGIMASLFNTKLEKNYLIKEFEILLQNIGMKDKRLASFAIQLIKYEIALILYNLKIQGLDWTRFKQTRLYMNELKHSSRQLLQPFYTKESPLSKEEQNEFLAIKKEYLRYIIIVHLITEPSDGQFLYPLDNSSNLKNLKFNEREKYDSLTLIRDWFYKIYLIHYNVHPNREFLEKLENIPEGYSEDYEEMYYKQMLMMKDITKMLREEGYTVEEKDRDFT